MTSEKTKWWKTPPYSNIVGGLVVALILWIIKTIYDWSQHTPVISDVGDWFRYVWNSLISFMNSPIPLWAVIGASFWYYVIYWWIHIQGKKNKVSTNISEDKNNHTPAMIPSTEKAVAPLALEYEETPISVRKKNLNLSKAVENQRTQRLNKMLEYTADKFNGIIWKWDWIYNDLIKQYEAKNIIPLCPHSTCKNIPMSFGITDNYGKNYLCSNCKSSTSIAYKEIVSESNVIKKVNNF